MNAIDVLMEDHQNVRELFRRYGEDNSLEHRERVSDQIFSALTIHTLVEEEIFYPAVEDLEPDMIEEAMDEHDTVDDLIEDLKGMRLDDPAFTTKMQELMDAVEHHVSEEEAEMFPFAQRELASQLDDLGRRIAEMKGRAQAAA